MKVVYDESHNQTWTIDPSLAISLSLRTNEAPRYYSYAHVAELIRSRFQSECIRLSQGPFTDEVLSGADLLILNHFCSSSHKHLGVGGEGTLSPEEIAAVARAVEKGMGLLVLGDFEIDTWGSNVNEVLAPFGLRLNNDTATVQVATARWQERLAVFEVSGFPEHPVTQGVHKVSYCSGCTISLLDGRAKPLIATADGAVLMAAADVGSGRVIAVGDSDLFAEPFLTYNDNTLLLVRTLEWLGKTAVGKAAPAPGLPQAFHTAHDLVAQVLANGTDPSEGTVIDITDEENKYLAELLEGLQSDPYQDFEAFYLESKLLFHELPRRIRRQLIEFSQKSNVDGVLMLRNFPVDRGIPPTPTKTGEKWSKPTRASELWLSCVAAALGEPVGYLQEKQGRIFQDIYPTAANADKLSSESSSILLDFHTEIAFHPFMPDYILLYGMRQDPLKEARTIFSSVRRFFQLLTPGDRDTLFLDLFRTGVDYSFGNFEEKQGAGPLVSILYGDRMDPFLRYDLDLMVGQTPAALHALQVVRELVNKVKRDVVIEPGSLVVLDNRRCVHARSNFTAFYDGRDRWLQRMAVVRDLQASFRDRVPGSRVIATDFSDYLNAVSAEGVAP
ncbi:MAG TPA: TauD/TfdA family dioxygenase [Thermoanaerobaculia bacterium]|nr:TauD/TfdA family dioxygenase [Thermoanaerobaculia bacterium]